MNLTLISAISENNVIGNNSRIPWRIPEDLARFKELTIDHPVIMGRKTYDALPEKNKPLPERKNIVFSKNLEKKENIFVARTIEEALELTEKKDSYVIGGKEIYELFLPYVSKMEITKVHKYYEGNVFFPEIDWNKWKLINQENKISEDISYSFLTYIKK